MNDEINRHDSFQEKHLLETLPLIHRIVAYKLGAKHRDSIEDVKQQVFLKLWRWKAKRSEKDLSESEWRNLASVTTYNKVLDFFSACRRRPLLFSQIDENIEEIELRLLFSESNQEPPFSSGLLSVEAQSLLLLVWRSAQDLTLRQKYAFFLPNPDFIIDFISAGCCSMKELADYFTATEREVSAITEGDSLPDKEIARMLEKKLGQSVSAKNVWEARGKAKSKIAKRLAVFLEYGGRRKEDAPEQR